MWSWIIPAAVLLGAVAGGCSGEDARAARDRPLPGALPAARVVDSAIPIEESLRRFRHQLTELTEFRGGADSREKLVRQLVRALESRDTAGLRRMALAVDEFAWLYYPSSPFSRPPYELPPDLMWFQIHGQSERGASKLLSLRAGAPIRYLGHACDSARTEGENRTYGHCAVRRLTENGDTVVERLFGPIVERDGKHKFVTYANDLD